MLHRILMLTILATGMIVDSGVFPPSMANATDTLIT